MNRVLAIVIPILIMAAMIPEMLLMEGIESLFLQIAALIAGMISGILVVLYCGFAALHAIQHLESPKERTKWFIITIVVNVFGSMYYYLTKYQKLKEQGRGGLLKF
ncbi:MAG: hypothetical protein AAFX93_10560 [Verrucomicrobiota bacterium]